MKIKFDLIYEHKDKTFSHYYQTLEELMADNSEWGVMFQQMRTNKNCFRLIAKRQYTGLKNTSNIEIYNEDILKNPKSGEFGTVTFYNGSYIVKLDKEVSVLLSTVLDWEVHGNIYENVKRMEE